MEESDQAPADAVPSSSSSHSDASSSSSNVELFSAASSDSSLTTDPRVEEEETGGNDAVNSILIQQRTSVSYDARLNVAENEENFRCIQDNSWSCVVIILTFWFFVSIAMILGVYGSSSFLLGPNSSILVRPNPLFVEYLKVEELEKASNQPTLYGFYRTPALDVVTTWSETHKASLPDRSHKEWVFFLNQGSQMNVSYNVESPGFSLIFVIAQGNEALSQWLEDPSHPGATLSWITIHGSGRIQQDIYMPSSYYVALANLNDEAVEVSLCPGYLLSICEQVGLNLEIKAFLYNTSEACYKCSLSHGECNLELSFNDGNIALLTSPSSTSIPGRGEDQWYVKLSYGPRWMTYIVGTSVMTVVMFMVFHLLNDFECRRETRVQHRFSRSERTRLLSNKDDDLSSWGSSYDTVSQDDEDLDPQAVGSLGLRTTKDGEFNNTHLCEICFDAPRDCFFLPCGHCVACFACGTRIAEAACTCPICRRHMKRVRKIFTV